MRSYFKKAYSVLNIHVEHLNGRYMIHNGRVIVFMIHPVHGLNSIDVKVKIFKSFLTLLQLYRVINPLHEVYFNI